MFEISRKETQCLVVQKFFFPYQINENNAKTTVISWQKNDIAYERPFKYSCSIK